MSIRILRKGFEGGEKGFPLHFQKLIDSDFFDGSGSQQYSMLLAIRICREREKSWPTWVNSQSCSDQDIPIYKRHLHFSTRKAFLLSIILFFTLIVEGISSKILYKENGLLILSPAPPLLTRRFRRQDTPWRDHY